MGGNCDDNNNNAACGWDGGDCCGPNVKKTYCDEVNGCKCLDCAYEAKGDECVTEIKKTCNPAFKKFKGDTLCDDENNIAGCDWDGGDCCEKSVGGPINKKWCDKCQCLDCTNKSE